MPEINEWNNDEVLSDIVLDDLLDECDSEPELDMFEENVA